MGIISNLSGPVPISPLYGSLQSVVVYSCSLPGRFPPMAPMPLDLNQRCKSSEEYFNLYHSVILLLQEGFNFKISPLSSDKAGPFPFLGFFLTAPSLQPVVLCRAENQLHLPSQSRAPPGRFHCCSMGCREPAELGRAIPTGTSTLRRMGRPLISSGKLLVGDRSLDTGRSMRVSKSVQLLSSLSYPCTASIPL